MEVFVLLLVAIPPVYATEKSMDSPFLKSFFRVEQFNPPRAADSWVLVSPDGATLPVQISSMRGRWGIVNIWATWCAPCLYELPKLDALAARFSGANDPYIWAVSVDRDVSRERLRVYMKRFGLGHVSVLQDASGSIRSSFDVKQLPVTFVIDPDGGVRAALYGAAEWDSDAAIDFVWSLKEKDRIGS